MKYWLLFVSLLIASSANACRTINANVALNNQIQVHYLGEDGAFSFRLPARLYKNSYRDTSISLIFKSPSDNKIVPELSRRVVAENNNGFLEGNLQITKLENYKTYLEVYWSHAKDEGCTAAIGIRELKML